LLATYLDRHHFGVELAVAHLDDPGRYGEVERGIDLGQVVRWQEPVMRTTQALERACEREGEELTAHQMSEMKERSSS
jgi:hypothetical protein